MSDLATSIADLNLGTLLREIDLVLALHDANLIDKDAVAKRWRETADRTDLELPDSVRKFLRLSAAGLEASGRKN